LGALFLFDPEQSDIPIAVSWQVVADLAALSAVFFGACLVLPSGRAAVRFGQGLR